MSRRSKTKPAPSIPADPLGVLPDIAIRTLDSLVPLTDEENTRRHTERNLGMIKYSLEKHGAGRSVLIDERNRIIGGNGVRKSALDAGTIKRVIVVQGSRDTLVAVQRSDLTEQEKLEMQIVDNRAAELAEWNAGKYMEIPEETRRLFFHKIEEERMLAIDTDFLSKVIKQSEDEWPEFKGETYEGDSVQVVFVMTSAQREMLMERITQVKEKHNFRMTHRAIAELANLTPLPFCSLSQSYRSAPAKKL